MPTAPTHSARLPASGVAIHAQNRSQSQSNSGIAIHAQNRSQSHSTLVDGRRFAHIHCLLGSACLAAGGMVAGLSGGGHADLASSPGTRNQHFSQMPRCCEWGANSGPAQTVQTSSDLAPCESCESCEPDFLRISGEMTVQMAWLLWRSSPSSTTQPTFRMAGALRLSRLVTIRGSL